MPFRFKIKWFSLESMDVAIDLGTTNWGEPLMILQLLNRWKMV